RMRTWPEQAVPCCAREKAPGLCLQRREATLQRLAAIGWARRSLAQSYAQLRQQRVGLVALSGATEVRQTQILLEIEPANRLRSLRHEVIEHRLRDSLEARPALGEADYKDARLQLLGQHEAAGLIVGPCEKALQSQLRRQCQRFAAGQV